MLQDEWTDPKDEKTTGDTTADSLSDKESTTQTFTIETKGLEVVINKGPWDKMFGWCKVAEGEVSGMGLVRKEGSKFVVYDVFLLKQDASGASTTLDSTDLARLMQRLRKRNIPLNHLRFWWHTHYNFDCFWSGTDADTIEQLVGTSADWALSMVINQRDQHKCRLDMLKPINATIDNLTVQVPNPISAQDREKYKKQVENKVVMASSSWSSKGEGWYDNLKGCLGFWDSKKGKYVASEDEIEDTKEGGTWEAPAIEDLEDVVREEEKNVTSSRGGMV